VNNSRFLNGFHIYYKLIQVMEENQDYKDPNQLDLFEDSVIEDTAPEMADTPEEFDPFTAPEILGWNSTEEQETLFFALQLFYDVNSSVLDVGAGRGDLYGYMKNLYLDTWDPSLYSGIDFNSYLVDVGKQKFPEANLEVGDLFSIDESVRYDWCMANGVFNLKIANYDMDEYTKSAIDKMYNIAEKGVAFNLLTSYDDSMSEEVIDAIHKFDAGEYLNYLTEKYGKVICRADYFPGDVTFFIFK
jgi:hypothetical protein